MIQIYDQIAGLELEFRYCETIEDCREAYAWSKRQGWLAMDTESTGLDCYAHEWELRTFQFGKAFEDNGISYVIPARFRRAIRAIFLNGPKNWIGWNGPHDVRCVDRHLGTDSGVVCWEAYIPAHHEDSRNKKEGGVGLGLKEQSIAHVDPMAGKWEEELKAEFKRIEIPIPGEYYKSGKRKGQPKVRKARLDEGWGLIDPTNRKYIAYAASDPILTWLRWEQLASQMQKPLYEMDARIQQACDRLQRRGLPADIPYTMKYSAALKRKADRAMARAKELGCDNIYSPVQVADALIMLGADLRERTPTGKFAVTDRVLKAVAATSKPAAKELARVILLAKRCSKRREAYAEAVLRGIGVDGRVHPSINSLAARTARMSVSRPPFQQLPTKDQAKESEENGVR